MSKENKRKEVFKDSDDAVKNNVAYLQKEVDDVKSKIERVAEKLDDPVFQGALMYSLVQEKENTNRVLKNIYVELERLKELEERVKRIESELGELEAPGKATGEGKATSKPPPEEIQALLPEVDLRIVEFIKKKGKVVAEDVRKECGYKGRNAASARLNKLYGMGLLRKKQAGRRVYYLPGGEL